MKKFPPTIVIFFCGYLASAQPPKANLYTLEQVSLPELLNKQVCISGMQFYKGQLYFASERCPLIIVHDIKAGTAIPLPIIVAGEFEMEGMTAYKNNFYLISEDIAAIYESPVAGGKLRQVQTSNVLPPKSKEGDGMEGIAANEKHEKFYLLRERNDEQSASQLMTYSVKKAANGTISLAFDSMIELPLENARWRYSDICLDVKNNRLLCLKSYAKGKFRQQYLEAMSIGSNGELLKETLADIPVENFTDASSAYKTQNFSMNLEGITIDDNGNIFLISDNTSGKATCDLVAKEKTILLQLHPVELKKAK